MGDPAERRDPKAWALLQEAMRLGQVRLRVSRVKRTEIYHVHLLIGAGHGEITVQQDRDGRRWARHRPRSAASASHPDFAAALARCVEAMRPRRASGRP